MWKNEINYNRSFNSLRNFFLFSCNGGENDFIYRRRRPACNLTRPLSSSNTEKRSNVFTLGSGLSSAIIVALGVFTRTLSWTEIVHMSRMIHLLARACNPLHVRWIIYTTLLSTPPSWHGLSTQPEFFFFLWSGSSQSRRPDFFMWNIMSTLVMAPC